MKKLLTILFALFLISCDKNCDEQYDQLDKDYKNALLNCGGSSIAIQQVIIQYNDKRNRLDKQCD